MTSSLTAGGGTARAGAALPPNARIVIISASVGAGHDGPADELARRLHRRGWWVDRVDGLNILPAHLGQGLQQLYLSAMRHTPTLWGPVLDSCADGLGSRATRAALDRLTQRTLALIGDVPHAVVSTYPLVSQLLGRLRMRGELTVPVLSYLTDPAVHPMWWHPGVDVVLAPHHCMLAQARRLAGTATDPSAGTTIVETAAALPRSLTAARSPEIVGAVREELGVPPHASLALVTAGSMGAGPVDKTAMDLASWRAWPVVLCARNERLRRRIDALGVGRALGWRDDVPDLLAAADIVVHNAGGLACWEALAAGGPVVSYRVLPGHGEANASVLHTEGIAPWARTRNDLGLILDEIPQAAGRSRPASRLLPDPAHVIHRLATARPLKVAAASPEPIASASASTVPRHINTAAGS